MAQKFWTHPQLRNQANPKSFLRKIVGQLCRDKHDKRDKRPTHPTINNVSINPNIISTNMTNQYHNQQPNMTNQQSLPSPFAFAGMSAINQ